jgi:cytochrome c oxidase cbb3-type subunit I
MYILTTLPKRLLSTTVILLATSTAIGQTPQAKQPGGSSGHGWLLLACFIALAMLVAAIFLLLRIQSSLNKLKEKADAEHPGVFKRYFNRFSSAQIDDILQSKQKNNHLPVGITVTLLLISGDTYAQGTGGSLTDQPGILITIVLIMIPLFVGLLLMIVKAARLFRRQQDQHNIREGKQLATHLQSIDQQVLREQLLQRKAALDFHLTNHELSGVETVLDKKGLIAETGTEETIPFVAVKKKAIKRPDIAPELARLITWYLCCAAFWLVLGTTAGEYLGIKFVSPDIDHTSWLSFGRLRPVHTNMVFWGWSSLAMLGLGHYIVPMVSNTRLYSIKMGWYALAFINGAVITGSLCLMAGINNGGGEYREYAWPVMLLFAAGLVLTLHNFLQTIARRTTKEIYISNWYIVAAIMFALVITLVAYLPWWQDGLGETIVQGFYMHQGVGMWFMLFTLGIVYYFLPQQLNKPIYSYSLGILAFWAQIFFYTVIGTHHFVFSSIPWWLQTTAIVGSIGMIIPVCAGFTNFLLTFKGAWHKLAGSYTLPFFLTGIVFYVTGSLQGTAEAFRFTNLLWHFTDFTVAHSHLTMYGIIAFFVWGSIYALLPRLTGREAPQITIGAHFWLALIGLLFYTIPLMYGSTLRGIMWMEKRPFIESVVLMAPYWLWRAIGGSLMWVSHLFFAWNVYKMLAPSKVSDIQETAIQQLKAAYQPTNGTFQQS